MRFFQGLSLLILFFFESFAFSEFDKQIKNAMENIEKRDIFLVLQILLIVKACFLVLGCSFSLWPKGAKDKVKKSPKGPSALGSRLLVLNN